MHGVNTILYLFQMKISFLLAVFFATPFLQMGLVVLCSVSFILLKINSIFGAQYVFPFSFLRISAKFEERIVPHREILDRKFIWTYPLSLTYGRPLYKLLIQVSSVGKILTSIPAGIIIL